MPGGSQDAVDDTATGAAADPTGAASARNSAAAGAASAPNGTASVPTDARSAGVPRSRAAERSPAPSRRQRRLLLAAMVLTGLSMRTAVTSLGAVLSDVEDALHTNSAVAGLITTLPALCFALFGALAPRFASRIGPHRLLLAAMATMTAGLVSRSLIGSAWVFIVLSVVSLFGAAVANVLMPMEVKTHFPDRIGPMTAMYTTAMAIGTTAGAGLTVPIGSLAPHADAWRLGIGSWAILSAVAIVPWLAVMRHSSAPGAAAASVRIRAAALARSRTAWMVTLFFAFQSMQAYIAFGWFERFLTEHSISGSSAGWMVALMSAMAIPTSMAAPMVPARHHRPLVVLLGVCYGGAYAGMNLAPGASWLWMVFAGVGNGMFPMSLTLMGYRTAAPATTASLSAFAQGVGYTIAATGPVLFGALHGTTGAWAAPFAVLWTALAISTIAGWLACTPRTVDDDLRTRPHRR